MITVRFTCKKCGLKKREVQVPARDTQTLNEWMEIVKHCVADDHRTAEPKCHNLKVDLWIDEPEGSEFLGQQVE
jgi:hypothetical protein